MLSKKQRDELNKIFKKQGVVLAYLFGSAAKKKLGPLSDIDISILFSEKIKTDEYFDKELQIASEIGSLFKIDRVDVINLKTVRNPFLRHRVVFEGILLFLKDKKIKFQIESEIMKEYEDTKYLRETAFALMTKRIKEGKFGKSYVPSR